MIKYNITLLDAPPMVQPFLGQEAFDLNNGSTVVGAAFKALLLSGALAVRWNLNPETLPPPLPGQQSVAHAVNEAGDVVGVWGKGLGHPWGRKVLAGEADPCQAFLYKNSDGMTHDLASVFGTESSGANDINDNGLIAGWGRQQQTCHAYVYNSETETAPTNLGALPGHAWSSALAINNKGHVVGISTPAQPSPAGPEGFHAFLYDGALKDLGPNRYAYDINDSGQVVGDWLVSGASYWTAFLCETSSGTPQFTNLGFRTRGGFEGSVATGINSHGDIVGLVRNPNLMGEVKIRPFVRPASGPFAGWMLNLNNLIPPDSGWFLHWASAINDNRQIVGTGTYNGVYRAYLLTPDWSYLVLPDDLDPLLTQILLRAPTTSSPGLVVTASGKKIPIWPWGPPVDPWGGPLRRLTPPQRDVLIGLAINVLASNINDPEARRIAEIGGLDTIRLTVDHLLGELGKSDA